MIREPWLKRLAEKLPETPMGETYEKQHKNREKREGLRPTPLAHAYSKAVSVKCILLGVAIVTLLTVVWRISASHHSTCRSGHHLSSYA
jgi:hypothetical protein